MTATGRCPDKAGRNVENLCTKYQHGNWSPARNDYSTLTQLGSADPVQVQTQKSKGGALIDNNDKYKRNNYENKRI